MTSHQTGWLRISGDTALFLAVVLVAGSSIAASYAEQKSELSKASRSLRTAERMLKADRLDEAVAAYAEADKHVAAVAGAPHERLARTLSRAIEQRDELRGKLSAAGAKLSAPAKVVRSTGPSFGDKPTGPPRGNPQVSFVKQVAPFFLQKCANCHVDSQKGGFSLASYDDLMKGSRGGAVFEPGMGMGSILIESLVSGDMPRGGGQATPVEVRMLMSWINQGAKFDGVNPKANLRDLKVGAAPPAETPPATPPAARPLGKQTVSFAADVAPLFVENCKRCHINDNNGRFVMETYRDLMREQVITPGAPDRSTLVRRLRGLEEPRMPMNGMPLADEEIDTIATWIREGAVFDGPGLGGSSDRDRLPRVADLAKAVKASPEQLTQMRTELSDRHWRTALSDETATTVTTDHLLIMGALPAARLESLGAVAEASLADAAKLFGADKQALGKARATLYVFDDRLDYSEFASMVERRSLPRKSLGHWRSDPLDAYGCVLLGGDDLTSDNYYLAEQAAGLVLSEAAAHRLPDWLGQGLSAAIAGRLEPDSTSAKEMDGAIGAALQTLGDPSKLISGDGPDDAVRIARYGFAKAMLGKRSKCVKLIEIIASGTPADEAMRRVYGRSPEELAGAWAASAGRRR